MKPLVTESPSSVQAETGSIFLDGSDSPDGSLLALAEKSDRRQTKLPAWLRPSELSPLEIDGNRLSGEQIQIVLGALRKEHV